MAPQITIMPPSYCNQSDEDNRMKTLDGKSFSKAFYTVPHRKLLHKLSHYTIAGTTLKWIDNFMIRRSMRVVLDGESSREVSVDSGVPQGTELGPLLFLCHINDLPSSVKSQACLLYRGIKTFCDHTALQDDLKQLQKGQWTGGRASTQTNLTPSVHV